MTTLRFGSAGPGTSWTSRGPRAAVARARGAVARARGAVAWSRGAVRAYPTLVDGLLAAAFLAVLGAHAALRPGAGYAVLAFSVGTYGPIIWRRRAPFPVFLAVAAVAFLQWLCGYFFPPADFALLVALYTVAASAALRLTAAAAGVMELGVALATVRWAPADRGLTMFVLLSGMATAATVLGLNVRTRRAYLASLEDRALRAERERDQRAQIAAAAERALIAREVHDIVTHSLSVMVALTDGASYAVHTAPDQAADAVGKASEVGRQAIAEMQRVLGALRSSEAEYRPQPGLDQIDTLLSEVRAAGLPVELVVTGAAPGLSSGLQLAAYRVVQEALTNTRKHAPAGSSARVRLRYRQECVEVEVIDVGRASASVPASLCASSENGDASGGHGIAGMRERVAVYGGSLEAGPMESGGWRVRAVLPVAEARGEERGEARGEAHGEEVTA